MSETMTSSKSENRLKEAQDAAWRGDQEEAISLSTAALATEPSEPALKIELYETLIYSLAVPGPMPARDLYRFRKSDRQLFLENVKALLQWSAVADRRQ